MERPITYREAYERFPFYVGEAIARLMDSRSRWRRFVPSTLRWKLSVATEFSGCRRKNHVRLVIHPIGSNMRYSSSTIVPTPKEFRIKT